MSNRNSQQIAKRATDGLRDFLRDRFNLDDDKAAEKQTVEEIKKGIYFRGPNLWILIFAIVVCSVGLNVNSAAVIIGAMLISPLMGPIVGVGLGVGINDFNLITTALKNLGIAALISILASALYFLISPLNDAQSELLARTSPTLFDVLIAFFGGAAGIVAGSRKEKSNAVPGVAIATALMPPLCTGGYGLATAQWSYFFGAIYLFFINCVFISLSTFLVVRALRFKTKEFMDDVKARRVKSYIAILVVLTAIPSVYTAVNVVRESIFKNRSQQFVTAEMTFENCQLIGKKYEYNRDSSRIELTYYGEPIDSILLVRAEQSMSQYGLNKTALVVRQGSVSNQSTLDYNQIERMNEDMASNIIRELYDKSEAELKTREARINYLEEEIVRLTRNVGFAKEIMQEAKIVNDNLLNLTIGDTYSMELDSLRKDTVFLAVAKFKKRPQQKEVDQLEKWLKVKTDQQQIRLVVEK